MTCLFIHEVQSQLSTVLSLTNNIRFSAKIENLPDILARTSYSWTDQGPSRSPSILSDPAPPAPILKVLCRGHTFHVNLSTQDNVIRITCTSHIAASYVTQGALLLFLPLVLLGGWGDIASW